MYMHGTESNIILHRMKIIIKCGKYFQNKYMHGTESNKILDMCRVIYNTQMVAAALGPWASHSEDRAEP